jgi:uncharacterized protein YbaA (DUF1428 family)
MEYRYKEDILHMFKWIHGLNEEEFNKIREDMLNDPRFKTKENKNVREFMIELFREEEERRYLGLA